jgi:hypothetical protein
VSKTVKHFQFFNGFIVEMFRQQNSLEILPLFGALSENPADCPPAPFFYKAPFELCGRTFGRSVRYGTRIDVQNLCLDRKAKMTLDVEVS